MLLNRFDKTGNGGISYTEFTTDVLGLQVGDFYSKVPSRKYTLLRIALLNLNTGTLETNAARLLAQLGLISQHVLACDL